VTVLLCDEVHSHLHQAFCLRARHENALPHSYDDITESGIAGEVLRRVSIGQLLSSMLHKYVHASLSR
jgi:hypothetical protein